MSAAATMPPAMTTCPKCNQVDVRVRSRKLLAHHTPTGEACDQRDAMLAPAAAPTPNLEPQQELPTEPAPPRARGVQSGLGGLLPTAAKGALPEAGRAVLVDVDLIDENPEMKKISVDQDTVKSLVESIPELGLISPVVLVPRAKGRYELKDGRHRTLAYRELLKQTKDEDAWGKIPALIRTDMDTKTEKAVQGAANQVRRKMSEYEEAINARAQMDAGATAAATAKSLGMSQATLFNRLKLLKLPQDLALRVGTDWFKNQHAEVVVAALSLGAKAEKAVRDAIKNCERDGYYQHADDFRQQVESELEDAGLVSRSSYQLRDAGNVPALKARIAALPKLEVPVTMNGKRDVDVWYTDPKAVEEILKDYREHNRPKEEKAPSGKKTEKEREAEKREAAKQRQERALDEEVASVELAAQMAAVKKVTDVDARVLALLAREFLNYAQDEIMDDDEELIAATLGVDVKVVRKLTDSSEKELLRMLRGKDKVLVVRVIVAMYLLRDNDPYSTHGIAQEFVKLDKSKMRAEAKKSLERKASLEAMTESLSKKGGKR